jgi:type III pantothenate kinase
VIPDPAPRWLLLDLGNSRLKWAWAAAGRLGAVQAVDHETADWLQAAGADWDTAPVPQRILLAAVAAPARLDALRAALARRFPAVEVEILASPARAGGWRSAYAEPARLGVDRYLAMRGAMAVQAGALLVAGCGTAVAVDLVDAQGLHRGGLIAPGPVLMRQSILARTGRVGWQRAGRLLDFGADTEDALQSGCWQAAAGLVEHALAAATRELGAVPAMVLHGGDAEALAQRLVPAARIVPALVFEGMLRHAR